MSWFRGIKGKLLLLAMVPMLGFVVISIISFQGSREIGSILRKSQQEVIPTLQALADLREFRNRFGYLAYEAISELRNGLDASEDLKNLKTTIERYKTALKAYNETPFMPEEAQKYDSIKDNIPKIIASMEKIHGLLSTKDAKNWNEAENLLGNEFKTLGASVRSYLLETVETYNKRIHDEGIQAAATEQSVTTWIWSVTLASILISLVLSIWISTRLAQSISGIVDRLYSASTSVTQSVQQLNEAGNGLSQSATEAAASLEETVASLEEMTSMVTHNSDSAKQAAALSHASREAAEKGESEIESLIKAMSDIAQSSKKIEEIISVIDDIAFQTNLLALNASVEAARAGEQGKGFAVVADAVRALAQRSADAAKDITVLIKDSVHKVENGGHIASQSEKVLHDIVTSVKKVADLNTEIASASAEQTAGIAQISKAMNQLDQASQGNAASAEEIAATSGEIANLAITTQKLTNELSLTIHGVSETSESSMPIEKITPKRQPLVQSKKVVSITSKAPKNTVQDVIPFDDEEGSRSRVGTTSGF